MLGLVIGATALSQMALGQDNSHRGRKYKAPPAVSKVEVTVLRATNGKPVTNASVIFHPLVHGKDSGNMELKTNDEGKALIDVIETGSTIRLQIIAPGYQTYGQDYKIDKPSMALDIKLNRPSTQYSIYNHGDSTPGAPKTAPDAGSKPQNDTPQKDQPQDSGNSTPSKPNAQ
uniref:Carboxypeptidase regulatory-like domain-containing protein n=1 Tax=mine drainage metagenome TaxID=410659 RepID=E6QK07_9ZZZZ